MQPLLFGEYIVPVLQKQVSLTLDKYIFAPPDKFSSSVLHLDLYKTSNAGDSPEFNNTWNIG